MCVGLRGQSSDSASRGGSFASMYATAVDHGGFADSAGTYTLGLHYFVSNVVAATTGWALNALLVLLLMYRGGGHTPIILR